MKAKKTSANTWEINNIEYKAKSWAEAVRQHVAMLEKDVSLFLTQRNKFRAECRRLEIELKARKKRKYKAKLPDAPDFALMLKDWWEEHKGDINPITLAFDYEQTPDFILAAKQILGDWEAE